jgi:hypothetical protein
VNLAKVCNLNMFAQTGLEVFNKVEVAGSNGAVIDVHCNDCDLVFGLVLLVKYGLVN